MKLCNPTVAAIGLVIAACTSALPADGSDAKTQEQSPSEVGMRVYVDPETGKLSSVPVTPEQMVEDEISGLEKGLSPVEEIRHPDGTVVTHLNGRFEVASQVDVGPDGRRIARCTLADHAGLPGHTHVLPQTQAEER